MRSIYQESYGFPGTHERQTLTFASVSMQDAADYPGRQIITLGTLSPENATGLPPLVQRFNRQSRQYRVEIVYEADEGGLIQKLLRGEGEDLVDLRAMYAEDLARMGVFEELDAYYESSPDVAQEDILDSVHRACAINGKNVSVIPGFTIEAIRARGDHTSCRFSRMERRRVSAS